MSINVNEKMAVGMRAAAGTAALVLLFSLGLEVYAGQAPGQASLATLLLALYLASWGMVLGIIGLVVASAWWLAGSWRQALTSGPSISARPRTVLVSEGIRVCG